MDKKELKVLVKAHQKPAGKMKKHELEDYANRHHLHIPLMTKAEVIHMVEISKCPMLKGMPVHNMTREQIIEDLHKKACPELQKYL
jgi:hypothetical protein